MHVSVLITVFSSAQSSADHLFYIAVLFQFILSFTLKSKRIAVSNT